MRAENGGKGGATYSVFLSGVYVYFEGWRKAARGGGGCAPRASHLTHPGRGNRTKNRRNSLATIAACVHAHTHACVRTCVCAPISRYPRLWRRARAFVRDPRIFGNLIKFVSSIGELWIEIISILYGFFIFLFNNRRSAAESSLG